MLFSGYYLGAYLFHPAIASANDTFSLDRESMVKNGDLQIVEKGLIDTKLFSTRNSIFEVQQGKNKWLVKQARTADTNYIASVQHEIRMYRLLQDQKLSHIIGEVKRSDELFWMMVFTFDKDQSITARFPDSEPNPDVFRPILKALGNTAKTLHSLDHNGLIKNYPNHWGFSKLLLLYLMPRDIDALITSTDLNKRKIAELLKDNNYSLSNKIREINWEANSLIHYDLKLDHVFCDAKANEMRVYDWEMADIGDYHWDVATVWLEILHSYPFEDTELAWKKGCQDFQFFLSGYGRPLNIQKLVQLLGVQILQRYYYGANLFQNPKIAALWLDEAVQMIINPNFTTCLNTYNGTDNNTISILPPTPHAPIGIERQKKFINEFVWGNNLDDQLNDLIDVISQEYKPTSSSIPSLKVLQNSIYQWFHGEFKANNTPVISDLASIPKADEVEVWTNRWWLVENKSTQGNVSIRKASERRFVKPGDYTTLGNDNTNENLESSTVNVISSKYFVSPNTTRKDSLDFWIMSEQRMRQDFPNWIRFYFHLYAKPEGIYLFIQEISKRLNERMIPFDIKLRNKLARYERADAGIIFVHRQHFMACIDTIAIVHRLLKGSGYMRQETPKFTKKLADGLSFTENPPDTDESFGNARARRIVEAITKDITVWNNPNTWLTQIKQRFWEDGFNLFELYRNPANPDKEAKYRFDLLNEKLTKPPQQGTDIQSSISYLPTQRYLKVAKQLAFVLCREAIWYGDNCNWIGFKQDNQGVRFESLNEWERKGVCLFLAGVSILAPNEGIFRYTALGAAQQEEDNKPYDNLYKQVYAWFENSNQRFTEITSKNFTFNTINKLPDLKDTLKKIQNPENDAFLLADFFIKKFIDSNIPFPNAFAENWNDRYGSEFCPTLTHGLAGLGYFFLRLADTTNLIKPLP